MDVVALPYIPYCGAAPVPADWWQAWNADPVVIAGLSAFALWCAIRPHLARVRVAANPRAAPLTGIAVAAIAWLTPLCAMGVALFSARLTQHLLLALVAAPLLAYGLPARSPRGGFFPLAAGCSFAAAFW
ncbi:MAG: cytochrome c oxidase assembly protein, partial [Gammaproteobacteria bacterium]